MATIAEALDTALKLYHTGNLDEAELRCREILEREPRQADAWHVLGLIALAKRNFTTSIDQIGRAIQLDATRPAYHHHLAEAYASLSGWPQVEACCRQALALQGDFAAAHNTLGKALDAQGKREQAIASFRAAISLAPDFAQAHFNLGSVFHALGQAGEAINCYRRAIEFDRHSATARNNLGVLLKQQGDLEQAVSNFEQATQLNPQYFRARYNLANAYASMQRPDLAEASYRRAIELAPHRFEPHNNLGTLLKIRGQFKEAMDCFDAALRCRNDSAETHRNRALLQLLLGHFAEGWPEYEWRWQVSGAEQLRFSQPRWQGQPLKGRTILLAAEQGLGDTIQFVRYARLVKERSGGSVILRSNPVLYPLLRSVSGVDGFAIPGRPAEPFDYYAPLMSLPPIFGTTVATIPADVPYLFAEPKRVRHWQQQLAGQSGFKVGVAWHGDPRFADDSDRSVPLVEFAPLARCPGVRLFSLQKGHGREQLPLVPPETLIVDLDDSLDEGTGAFVDTAAVMKNLDLVITSDTAIAHLAGALAVPAWVALPFLPDWRWLLARDDSPWYPTMRLFRQSRPGDWRAVFARITDALAMLMASR